MQIPMFAAFFVAYDDGIGRVDRSTLPQQTLMELFIFGLNEPEEICRSRDDPADVCEWEGVNCNADGEVAEFEWNNEHQAGTLASMQYQNAADVLERPQWYNPTC